MIQQRIEHLARELFGTSQPYVMLGLESDEPKLIRHDGRGKVLDRATWNGFRWVKESRNGNDGSRLLEVRDDSH